MGTSNTRTWIPRVAVFLGLAAFFAGICAQVEAAPDDAGGTSTATLDPQEHDRRLHLLRRAAQAFHFERKAFPKTCHHCDGTGRVGGRIRRRGSKSVGIGSTFSACPTCKGNGTYVSETSFMKVFFAMRSPAFRATAGRQEQIEALHAKAQRGELDLPRMHRYVYERGELLDAEHAVAWYRFDKRKTPVATRWIWSGDAGKKPRWFAYATQSDGAWPRPARSLTSIVEAAKRAEDWRSLPHARRRRLAEAMAAAGRDLGDFVAQTNGADLRLREKARPAQAMGREDVARHALDAAEIAAAVHAADLGYDHVRLELRLPMRAPSGNLRMKLGVRVELRRSDAAGWTALDLPERVARLAVVELDVPGHGLAIDGDA